MEEENLLPQPSTTNNENFSDVKFIEGRIKQDFAKKESVNILMNEEVPPEPSSSKNDKLSDVKSIEHEKVQDFDKEESTNTLIEDEVTPEPSNTNHLQTKRKRRKKRKRCRPDKPKLTHSEARNLAVVIRRADGALVTRELATIIRKRLLDCILQAGRNNVDGHKLQFHNSGLVDAGYFLVTAVNEQSRDWLMSCKIGSYEGVALRMFRRAKEKKKVPKSGSNTNNQDFHKETSINAPLKEQESLSKPSGSCKEINNQDFDTEESIKIINNEVKNSPYPSGNGEGIINDDFAAEESIVNDEKKGETLPVLLKVEKE